MIHNYNLSSRFTDPLRFFNHSDRIGYHGDNVEGHDIIESVVSELQIERIHLHDFQMRPTVLANFLTSAGQHVGSEVNSRDLTVRWVGGKGGAGSRTYLQNPGAGRDVKILDDAFESGVKDLAEDFVVKWSEVRV